MMREFEIERQFQIKIDIIKANKGIYYLKGGDVTDAPLFADRGALLQEIDVALKKNGLSRDNVKIFNICDAFEEEFFEQKRVLFISDKKF